MTEPVAKTIPPVVEQALPAIRAMFRTNVESYDQTMPMLFGFVSDGVHAIGIEGEVADGLEDLHEQGLRVDAGVLCAETWATKLDKNLQIDGMIESATLFIFTPERCLVEQMPFLRTGGTVDWRDGSTINDTIADDRIFRALKALLDQ